MNGFMFLCGLCRLKGWLGSQLPEKQTDKDVIIGLTEFNCSNIRNMSTVSFDRTLPLFNELLTLHKTSMQRVKTVIDHIYGFRFDIPKVRYSEGILAISCIWNHLFGIK